MFKNEYTLNVDIKRKFTALVPTFVQNDTATLIFKIFNNGMPYDLSSFTSAEVTTQRKDGSVVIGKAYIEGSVGNQYIRYEYLGNEMAESGFAQTTLTIFSDTTRVSILPFKINIVADIRDAIGASEEYGVLQDLIVRVEDVLGSVEQAVTNANEATNNTNTAISEANIATNSANIAAINADEKALLAQNASIIAADKADLANIAAMSANEKAILAEESSVLASNAATNANNAKDAANTATGKANVATALAESATTGANQAKTDAITAANNANIAKNNANQAVLNADTATQNANKAASDALLAKQLTEQATTNANTASDNANNAASEALTAKDSVEVAISNAEAAIQNANNSATNAQIIVNDTGSTGTFVLGKAYKKNNLVLDNGSTWITLMNTQNNPLPVLPITENTWWRLVAQRGIDGEGSVSSVNGTFPDVNGNVTIDLGDSITSVDGFAPDVSGNVISHTNKDVLDGLTDESGQLKYNGTTVGSVTSVNGQVGEVTGLQTVTDSNTKLATKVDKVVGKQLSTEDFTTIEKTKLTGIETGAQVNTITSVNGQSGAITGLATDTSVDGKIATINNAKIDKTVINQPNGVAGLDEYGDLGTDMIIDRVSQQPLSQTVSDVFSHQSNQEIHVTQTEKNEWDAKATPTYVDNKIGILDSNLNTNTAYLIELKVNVRVFGAKLDGITDDTAAINNAINSLPTGTFGGGEVYIPSGSVRITSPILVKAGVTLSGASPQATRIFSDNTDFIMINLTEAHRSKVKNLMLDGVGKTGMYGIAMYDLVGCTIENVWIDSLGNGVLTSNSYYLDFTSVRMMGTARGYWLTSASNVINMTNCYSITTEYAILWENSSTIRVSGCSFEGKGKITLRNVQGASFNGNYWEGLHEEPDIESFVEIGGVTGNNSSAKGVSFTGNFFLVKSQYGIKLNACEGVNIEGNYFGTSVSGILIYQYDNVPKRGIDIGVNSYDIGNLGHDITRAISYDGGDFDSLNCNFNETQLQPLMFTKQKTPQNTSLELESGVLYWDGTALKVKIKDATGAVTIKTVTLTQEI